MIPNRWTHRLTAERETDSAGTDEYGQPLPGGSGFPKRMRKLSKSES